MSRLGAGPVFRLRSQDWGWLWLDLVEFCILRPIPEGSGPRARSWCGKWFTAPRPRARGSWARVAGATGCLPVPPGPLWPLWAAMGRNGPLGTTVGRRGPLWAALDRSGPLWAALGSFRPLQAAGATASRWEALLGFLRSAEGPCGRSGAAGSMKVACAFAREAPIPIPPRRSSTNSRVTAFGRSYVNIPAPTPP